MEFTIDKVEKVPKLKACKAPRRRIKLDQFSKVLLAYFSIMTGVVVTVGLIKDIYFMFVAPEFMDWGSLYMLVASIATGGLVGYLIKCALEKNRTGKDTDAEGMEDFLNNTEGTYNVPEIM